MDVTAGSIDAAASYATCTGDFAGDWCVPIWPKNEARQLAVALVTVGWWESRFAQHVHEGRCGPQECDPHKLPDGRIVHRARSPWQVQWSSVTKDHWPYMQGTAEVPTFEAAYGAARVMAAGRAHCRRRGPWITVVLSAYAGVGCSTWPGAQQRVVTYEKLMRQLRAHEARREQPPEPEVVAARYR